MYESPVETHLQQDLLLIVALAATGTHWYSTSLDNDNINNNSNSNMDMKSSMELWAASKFIGRECATINKLFYICKRDNGDEPKACAAEGKGVTACGNQV